MTGRKQQRLRAAFSEGNIRAGFLVWESYQKQKGGGDIFGVKKCSLWKRNMTYMYFYLQIGGKE
jgi:hypothetical protein